MGIETIVNGIPTAPDVKRIEEATGELKEGDVINYKTIETAIGARIGTARFRGVVSAWQRKLLRQHNIVVIVKDPKQSYVVADPEKRISHSASLVERGRRSVGKAVVIAHGTDEKRLSEKDQKTRLNIAGLNETKLRMISGLRSV